MDYEEIISCKRNIDGAMHKVAIQKQKHLYRLSFNNCTVEGLKSQKEIINVLSEMLLAMVEQIDEAEKARIWGN